MNASPRRTIYQKLPPKWVGFLPGVESSQTGSKSSSQGFNSKFTMQGNGQGGDNKPPNLDLESLLWGDMEEAFKAIAPQLYPLIDNGKSPIETESHTTRELKKNSFCLIQLKSYETSKPDWLFGRIKTSVPENSLPENLSNAEILIPDRVNSMGVLKLSSKDVYASSIVKTWQVRVHAWVEDAEFEKLASHSQELNNAGFRSEKHTDSNNLSDFTGLAWSEKKLQPWIYIVSSAWLSKFGTHESNAIKANLRFLLQLKNRIIINLLSDSHKGLNRSCDLKPGRDTPIFQEAETPSEVVNMLPGLFSDLIQSPLNYIE